MVLFWGVRPEGEKSSLPFLLPIGVELFLDASSAPSAVLESFFPAALWAAFLRSSQDLAAGDFVFDDDLNDDPDLSTEDLLDEDFSR